MHLSGHNNSLAVYTTLLQRLLQDIADCYTDSDSSRDWKKIQSRLDSEGYSFLTKTLPMLGKLFDKALQGKVAFTCQGFAKIPGTVLPKLFGWLHKRIFDSQGYVRGDADIQAIKYARQLLYFSYKLALPYDTRTSNKVLESFVRTEEELKKLKLDSKDAVIREARVFITRLLGRTEPRDIIPRHGPGAVATGEHGGEKTHFSRVYDSLEKIYPFTEYFQLSLNQTVDQLHRYKDLQNLSAGTAKVVLVNKDSRGPRLISCEPLELQWIQQGQQRKLYDIIENHRLTRGHVNFTCQEINRSLALQGSIDRKIVTLDMKDASDRVSVALFQELFCGTKWEQALLASRSPQTRLPNGVILPLVKLAPMGSAICFPIEALTFYALAVSILRVYKQYSWRGAMKSVFVYGDDIICDRQDYPIIMKHFPRFGLTFNSDKCCTSGFFRESCGCDAYKGVDVTPIRLRTRWNHRLRTDASQLVSYVELSNALHEAGYYRAADYIEQEVQRLYGVIPYVEYRERVNHKNLKSYVTSPGRVIGFYRPGVNPITRNRSVGVRYGYNPHFQRQEIRGYIVRPCHFRYKEDNWEACLRTLVSGSTGLPRGVYAIPHRSRLQRGMGAA
jgi:hypothetical protein